MAFDRPALSPSSSITVAVKIVHSRFPGDLMIFVLGCHTRSARFMLLPVMSLRPFKRFVLRDVMVRGTVVTTPGCPPPPAKSVYHRLPNRNAICHHVLAHHV